MRANFKRARKPEEKELRRTLLLGAARARLHRDFDLKTFSLSELARSSKMTKSNVYRYFETREALLLALLWEEWASWFLAIRSRLESSGAPESRHAPEALAREVARSWADRRLLCALTAALPSVVEQNLSEGAIREFKAASLTALMEFGRFLERCCPEMSAERHARWVYDGACLLAGIFPHANPAKTVARVLRSPDLAFFRHDLETDLERMMLALVRDLSARA